MEFNPQLRENVVAKLLETTETPREVIEDAIVGVFTVTNKEIEEYLVNHLSSVLDVRMVSIRVFELFSRIRKIMVTVEVTPDKGIIVRENNLPKAMRERLNVSPVIYKFSKDTQDILEPLRPMGMDLKIKEHYETENRLAFQINFHEVIYQYTGSKYDKRQYAFPIINHEYHDGKFSDFTLTICIRKPINETQYKENSSR